VKRIDVVSTLLPCSIESNVEWRNWCCWHITSLQYRK